MPPKKQIGVSGKVIKSQTREVIANVLKFMKKEAAKGAPLIPVTNYKQRLLAATGISDKVYRTILRDMELIESGQLTTFTQPTRNQNKPQFTIEVIHADIEIKNEPLKDE